MANEMMQFEIVKNVTVPFFIIPQDGAPAFIRFNSAIEPDQSTFSDRVRKSRKDGDANAVQQPPMNIAKITNLQTGEEMRLVAHSVLQSNLEEAYADKTYVGKCFKVEKTKAQGKRYFNFNIVEIKLKSQEQENKQERKR